MNDHLVNAVLTLVLAALAFNLPDILGYMLVVFTGMHVAGAILEGTRQ